MVTEATIDEHVGRVLAGETDLYADIVNFYQRDIWRVVMAMLHDLDRSQELVEQTFVEAYVSLNQYERGRNFGFWLKSIARNVVRQQLRQQTRESKRLEIYRDHLKARLDAESEEQIDAADDAVAAALIQCREKLAPHAAQALMLRYQQSKSFEEIAAEMGRTVAATRQLLSRVRLTLRECIDRSVARA